MTKFTFKNPLAVTEEDTIGSAILKGATEGYLKGMVVSGLGLCVLAVIGKAVSKKAENSKKKEEEEIIEDEELVEEIQAV